MRLCPQCQKTAIGTAKFCSNCGAGFSPDRASVIRHWIYLAVAFVWSAITVVVCLRYHVPEPSGVLSVTTNGHTYTGHPPALTLYQRDPVALVNIVIAVSVGLLIATADLVRRAVGRTTRMSVAAIIIGAVVFLYSLFGLLLGVASLGVIGALLMLAGLPIRPRALTSFTGPTPSLLEPDDL